MNESVDVTRLSIASSTRSSLPSMMDGEEGGGEDPWLHSILGKDALRIVNDCQSGDVNWKQRYLDLEMSLAKFRAQGERMRILLTDKMAELQQKVWVTEKRAREAEKKAQVMEKRFSELEFTNTSCSSCLRVSSNDQGKDCLHRDCLITTLEQQIEEQKRLRICDAKQVEDKAAKIKEWVTNKIKELEDQNLNLREQNQKCVLELELMKDSLNHISQQSPEYYRKHIRNRGSTEDSSRGSFEDRNSQDSDDSLPPPEALNNSSLFNNMQKEQLNVEAHDICCDCSSPLNNKADNVGSFESPLYASVNLPKTMPYCSATEPPKLHLERKKYTAYRCSTPSTISTTSEHRLSDGDYLIWNHESPQTTSGSVGFENPQHILCSEPTDLSYSDSITHKSSQDLHISTEKQSSLVPEIKDTFDPICSPDDETTHISFNHCVNRPLTAPNLILHSYDDMDECLRYAENAMPDKNKLTLNELASSLQVYQDCSSSQDELHDYAEIYTPNKECADFCMDNEDCESGVTDDTSVTGRKAPTPPLHRFPSWESKIYEVAKQGINLPTEIFDIPASDTSNNNQNKMSQDSSNANAAFTDLSIPVYASVKGRASQIRSAPFTGDSSDSSDNEDARVTMTTTSSQTTSGSSTSVGAGCDVSPDEKNNSMINRPSSSQQLQFNSSITFTKCHRTNSSPMKIVQREMSNESILSDDYAVPPDAVSIDQVTLESTDNKTSISNTPTLYRKLIHVDETPRKDMLEKSGYLTKLGGKFKTWRRRWFVLKNGSLSYYKSQTDINRKPQGQIALDSVCHVNRAEGAATFEISTGKRIYYLTADSINRMEEWIKVIQNVLRRNASQLILTKDDKPIVEGWLSKVKHGHSRRLWCTVIGRTFLYFKTPNDSIPLGQINMREAKVEEVLHVSDSDEEEEPDRLSRSEYTIGIFPYHQSPTYLLMDNKQELDSWVYHLTIISSGDHLAGTQYEQLTAKLMEANGDENNVLWKQPLLLYSKDPISQSLTTLPTEELQQEAVKLYKSLQLFISVPLDASGIEYHVALAQNSLHQCLLYPELQNELYCQLIKLTSKHSHHKTGVQQLLICATQSLFLCDTSSSEKNSPSSGNIDKPVPSESKLNPAPFVFIQAWQLLAIAVSLFLPKNRILWYLRTHLQRNSNSKLEAGKYAMFCQRALERTISNSGRECKPSRMEVLSILLKNPYHHSLPHSIPVHFVNGTYQVFGFDGSTTILEFIGTVNKDIGIRDCEFSGFALFSDDPIEKDLEHCLLKDAKLCDVISQWEEALRIQHLGKFENTKILKLIYKNRINLRQYVKTETEKEKLLLAYQISEDVREGKFPLSKELGIELAALLAQVEFGDYSSEVNRTCDIKNKPNQIAQVMDNFFPRKYRDTIDDRNTSELIKEKWLGLKQRSSLDCIRIYLNCTRKWSFTGGKLFPAKLKCSSIKKVWIAVTDISIAVLDEITLQCLVQYPYASVMTFGGCRDDFMLVISSQCESSEKDRCSTERLLFAMTKPKILELTLLIADYMNTIIQNDSYMNISTSAPPLSPRGSFSTNLHFEKIRSKIRSSKAVSQSSHTTAGSIAVDSSPLHNKISH